MKRQAPDPDGAVQDLDDAYGTTPRAAELQPGAARGTEASARGALFLRERCCEPDPEPQASTVMGGCHSSVGQAGRAAKSDPGHGVHGDGAAEAADFSRQHAKTAYEGSARQEGDQGGLRHVSARALGGTGLVNQECEPRPHLAPDDPDACRGRQVRVQAKVTLKKSSNEVAGQTVDGGAGLQVVHRILSIPLELDQEGIPVNNGYKVTMIMIHAAFANELGACDPLQASTSP